MRPGPVGVQFSFFRVMALDAERSSPMNIASQPKCASASSGVMLDTEAHFQTPADRLCDCFHRHAFFIDGVIDGPRLCFFKR